VGEVWICSGQSNMDLPLACAKANSKLVEARRDVWDMDGSENHHMASKVSNFLVAQFLKDIPAYADLKYDDGSTARQQYDARLAYWHRWIDSRARRGLFMEDGGSSYQNYTNFGTFKAALKAQPITWANGVLKFATITHEGPLAPGKVNGKPVELRPSRVNDSPFILGRVTMPGKSPSTFGSSRNGRPRGWSPGMSPSRSGPSTQ
jgi:hypothetical protein